MLRSLENDAKQPDSLLHRRAGDRRGALLEIVGSVEKELQGFQRLVEKYKSLDTEQARVFDRLRFAPKQLEQTRVNIFRHVSYLTQFRDGLHGEQLSRIEKLLEQPIKDRVRSKSRSIATIREDGSENAWSALMTELVDEGLSQNDVMRHRRSIKQHIRILIEHNDAREASKSQKNDAPGDRFLSPGRKSPAQPSKVGVDRNVKEADKKGSSPRGKSPVQPKTVTFDLRPKEVGKKGSSPRATSPAQPNKTMVDPGAKKVGRKENRPEVESAKLGVPASDFRRNSISMISAAKQNIHSGNTPEKIPDIIIGICFEFSKCCKSDVQRSDYPFLG